MGRYFLKHTEFPHLSFYQYLRFVVCAWQVAARLREREEQHRQARKVDVGDAFNSTLMCSQHLYGFSFCIFAHISRHVIDSVLPLCLVAQLAL